MNSPIYGKLQNSNERFQTELSKWIYLYDIINTWFLPHLSYRFMHITQKHRELFFWIDKLILKFTWNGKRPEKTTSYEEESCKTDTSLFKIFYKIIPVETLWYYCKNRHIDQWHRAESPEIDLHKYSQLVLDQRTKVMTF